MVHDKVIYTDGHDVMVTGSVLQVRQDEYRLKGITRHGLQTISPRRWPGALLLLVGFSLSVAGYFRVFPTAYFTDLKVYEIKMPDYTVVMALGGFLMLLGVFTLGLIKERYAVRIETAEGEKDVVISKKQEYVQQINEALNRALFKIHTSVKTA
jgi:hypothetical protein